MSDSKDYDSLIETVPVTVVLEKPTMLEKEFTSRDQIMNELGLTREKLLGEAVRYTLVRGRNTNFLELEAPIDDIESNLDLFIDTSGLDDEGNEEVNKAVGMFVDKALEVTTTSMMESHAIVSNIPEVMALHEKLQQRYGKEYNMQLKDVKCDNSTGLTKVELSLEREIRVATSTGEVVSLEDPLNVQGQ